MMRIWKCVDSARTPMSSLPSFVCVTLWSCHRDKSGPGMEVQGTRSFLGPTACMTSGCTLSAESALSHMMRARDVLRSSDSCPADIWEIFEVHTVMNFKITVPWDVIPCSLVRRANTLFFYPLGENSSYPTIRLCSITSRRAVTLTIKYSEPANRLKQDILFPNMFFFADLHPSAVT